MSLFKKPWFWVIAGIVAAGSAYMIRYVSAVGFVVCYILTSTAFALAIRTYLDRFDFADEWMDAAWRSDV